MTLVAIDWNATRAQLLLGRAGEYALPVPLEPPALELPMTLSLERYPPQLGSPGRGLLRQAAHHVCHDFLAHVDAPCGKGPRWKAGRHVLEARDAVALVWLRLQAVCKGSTGVVLALPGYLSGAQAELVRSLGAKLRVPVLGSLPTSLAAALAAHAERFWSRSVLVLDIDDHALVATLVRSADDKAHIVETRSMPALGLRAWHDRLINALADLCVWQLRRDPRDTPSAEQSLFEQLDALMDAAAHQRPLQLGIQGHQWYHHVLIQPDQTLGVCAPLVEQVCAETERLVLGLPAHEAPAGVVLTHAAGRLPGLADAARALVRGWSHQNDTLAMTAHTAVEDFGENLDGDAADEVGGVLMLPADAPARAAHGLAEAFRRGDLLPGHQAYLAPLPPPQTVDAGPARLHFQGQDYFLRESSFTLGSQPDCQLRFDAGAHSCVAPRHCEIVFDRRTFILFNRSRDATFVNDQSVTGSIVLQPGDWIRLGNDGPTVRFLGGWTHRPLPTPA